MAMLLWISRTQLLPQGSASRFTSMNGKFPSTRKYVKSHVQLFRFVLKAFCHFFFKRGICFFSSFFKKLFSWYCFIFAYIQGKEALKNQFKNSLFHCHSDGYLPVVLSPPRDGVVRSKPVIVGRRCPPPIKAAGNPKRPWNKPSPCPLSLATCVFSISRAN